MEKQTSIGALLRERARVAPDGPFLRFEGHTLRFAQADATVSRLANILRALGYGGGVRIAVCLPNGFEFPLSWLAIARSGNIIVPLNPDYLEHDFQHVLNDAGAAAIITVPSLAAKLETVRARCPGVKQLLLWPEAAGTVGPTQVDLAMALASAETAWHDDGSVGASTLVNLQYTSGTTGFPKGCMLTHAYWLDVAEVASTLFAPGPDDVNLTAQPFYYMDPQWNTLLALRFGTPLVILPRFSASRFWQTIVKEGITFFYCIGTMPVFLYQQAPDPVHERGHRLRVVFCSGIPANLHAAFEARWGVRWREAYGMTETGVDLAVMPDVCSSVGSGSIGWPVAGKQVAILAPDGAELGDGEQGELAVRGTPLMLGYWNNEPATAATMRDGWLHTGDLAFRDHAGAYYLVGRLKDMIRRGGENIAAAEVEAVLRLHPDIANAAVTAVPDALRGEEVIAFLMLGPEAALLRSAPGLAVEHVRQHLAPFKAPRFIALVDAFPLTASFRVEKHKLLQAHRDGGLAVYDTLNALWRTL